MRHYTLTMLLYLGGEPDIVRPIHPGEEPIKESLRRRDPERLKDLDEPRTTRSARNFAVGGSRSARGAVFRLKFKPALRE